MWRALGIAVALPAVVAILFTAIGYFGATREPVVVRYSVGLADWPADTPPLRIVQLSDIHYGVPDMPASRVAAIVAQTNALTPDIIVLTGDFHGGKLWDLDSGNMDKAVRPLKRLRARFGVFAVRGNHDGPYWTPRVFARTPITLLQDHWAEAGPVIIAGVDDIGGPGDANTATYRAAAGAPAGKPVIVLAHEPDFFKVLTPRADLLIAGHTHGGQIKLPLVGAHSTGMPFEDAHLRGQFVEHGRQLIVSSGLGTSIVPLRIGVPPEIVEITLGPVTR